MPRCWASSAARRSRSPRCTRVSNGTPSRPRAAPWPASCPATRWRRATAPCIESVCHLRPVSFFAAPGVPMKALISAYARSPFHFARKGALAGVRPDTLAAAVVQDLLRRTGLDPALLEDVVLGCAYPEAAQGNNLARIVGLLAGLPQEVGGMTVNRFCGSSMQAVHIAAAQIEAGVGEAFLCVGVESMSMVPQGGFNFPPPPQLQAQTAAYVSMGETAENVAQRWNVTRADQEALAVASHRKAAAAREEGRLAAETVPIVLEGGTRVEADGCIRPATSAEALAALRPAFRSDGVVTA